MIGQLVNKIFIMCFEENPEKITTPELYKKKLYEGIGPVDFHYEICSTFLRNTGENLNKNELRLMAESNKLLDSLTQSKTLQKQNQTLSDSQSNSTASRTRLWRGLDSDNLDSRILSRKSPKAKNFCLTLGDELYEIEQKCSQDTIKRIKVLFNEHKKLKDLYGDLELKEKKQARKIQKLQQEQQKYLVLLKEKQQTEKLIGKLEAQVQQQKQKNTSSSNAEIRKMKECTDPLIDPKILQELTNYLNEKERSVEEKMKKVINVEENILRVVSNNISDAGCAKCCSFLKKIKDFILKFRTSLKEQSEDIEKIYNRYKAIFCFTQS